MWGRGGEIELMSDIEIEECLKFVKNIAKIRSLHATEIFKNRLCFEQNKLSESKTVPKNARFHADFQSIEKVLKKLTKKLLTKN
jgi:hypothetical protein